MVKVDFEGKEYKYDLIQYDKPAGDYLVLESLSLAKKKNTSRVIHIVKPTEAKTVFTLGRSNQSDLRI